MAKRKITVTVDDHLVEAVKLLGAEPLSAVVNAALGAEVERRSRAASLRAALDGWDSAYGPVSPAAAAAAAAAFDDLDALAVAPAASKSRRRRRVA